MYFKIYSALFLALLLVPQFIFAQGLGGNQESTGGVGGNGNETGGLGPNPSFQGSTQLQDPLKDGISTIPDFFRAIIEILLVFAIPFVVFFIVWAGFLYVTARGNPEKIKQAHNALLYALIGGLLILGANLLLDIITNTVDQVRN